MAADVYRGEHNLTVSRVTQPPFRPRSAGTTTRIGEMPLSLPGRRQLRVVMTYQHVIMTHHGDASVLEIAAAELPAPMPHEVRVRVLAAGVAYTDILIREGLYPGMPKPPFTLGYDVVGIVDAVGAQVSTVPVGQLVAALTVTGGYSEYLCLSASDVVPVPDTVEAAAAVALVLHYVTAYQMLHRVAQVKPGQSILIHGAAGGVGTALLQLARLTELEVYGTAAAAKHDHIRQWGAIPIDYRHEDFVQRIADLTAAGVDAVFDLVGGPHLFRSYRVLKPHGTLINFGFMAAAQANRGRQLRLLQNFLCLGLLQLRWLQSKRVAFYSITAMKQRHPDWFRQDLTTLLELLAKGQIHPVIAQRLSLAEAAQAQTLLERSAVSGALVLLCN
ncbi:Oxidoreductase [Halomicronema hongdechloris C2206]|uniref:Oxidoreductase n=1 Tax=Halomicronema hongdechloris C2206 TaxID=1641165 RepID=A0A1Z3HQH9_9CYAN|nr:medium chain dehydrogenase/reductase family protein [Halomicronema hongdechloris]ASC72574.1 Oxidoreductase [Halomicronema hongdechloris C2206]